MSIPPGVTCTLEEWTLSQDVPKGTAQQIQCLAPTDFIGLTVIVASGTCSLAAMTYVVYRIVKRMWFLKRRALDVFEHGASIFMLSLFVADIIQAIGAVLAIRWIVIKKVEVGAFCTAQGVVQQLGETAVAIATITIAVETLVSIWRNKPISDKGTALAITSLTWIPVAIMVIVGNLINRGANRQFISPTPYWCWISRPYIYTWRIGGEYFWLWLALVVSILTNAPLYFWLRGNVDIQHDETTLTPKKVVFQSSKRMPRPHTKKEYLRRKNAAIMLAYPLVYSITIVPLSIVRFIGFSQEKRDPEGKSHIQPAATLAVAAIHASSGFLNAILFLTSRRDSTLFSGTKGAKSDETQIELGHVNPPGNQSNVSIPHAGGSAGPAYGKDSQFDTPVSRTKTASSVAVYAY